MLVFLRIFLLLSVLYFLSCEKKKPDYLAYEDYSYLQRSGGKVLLVLKVSVDTVYDDVHLEESVEFQDLLGGHNFQVSYRDELSSFLLKSGGILRVESGSAAQDESYNYFRYFGNLYPSGLGEEGYDLVLELDIRSILSFSYGYLNFSKRESVRLLDARTNYNYLTRVNSVTRESVAKYIHLQRDSVKFLSLVEDLINMSVGSLTAYLLNRLPRPRAEDITPLLPELEGDVDEYEYED